MSANVSVITEQPAGTMRAVRAEVGWQQEQHLRDIRCGTGGLCVGLAVAAVCCCVGDKVAALGSLMFGCVAPTVIGDPPTGGLEARVFGPAVADPGTDGVRTAAPYVPL